jgi:hypothetical protein
MNLQQQACMRDHAGMPMPAGAAVPVHASHANAMILDAGTSKHCHAIEERNPWEMLLTAAMLSSL